MKRYLKVISVSCVYKSSPLGVFLERGIVKISSKFTGEHPCQNVISIKLLYNFIEITLWHGCSSVNLLHIFRKLFYKNTSGELLLCISVSHIFFFNLQKTYSSLNKFRFSLSFRKMEIGSR